MSDGIDALQGLFSDDARPPSRRRRGWAIAAWSVGVLVILLGGAAIVADMGLRSTVESVAASEIRQRLPDGVAGNPSVHIGGTSVILQYLRGSFDEVRIDASDLTIDGVPVPVRVTAEGVPTDLTKHIDHVTAVAELGTDAVNAIVHIPGVSAPLTLGDGTIGYESAGSVLGVPVSYHVNAAPTADGTRILLKPASAKVTAGPVGIDATGFVNDLLGQKPIPVCVAEDLPAGVELTDIAVTPRAATITLEAKDVAISSDTLAEKGDC